MKCDCGKSYKTAAGVLSCELNDHGRPQPVEPRPAVQRFAVRIEARLRANDHKGGWAGMTDEQLYLRTVEELDELIKEIQWNGGPERIADEAADAAAFLMMIADKVWRPNVEKK